MTAFAELDAQNQILSREAAEAIAHYAVHAPPRSAMRPVSILDVIRAGDVLIVADERNGPHPSSMTTPAPVGRSNLAALETKQHVLSVHLALISAHGCLAWHSLPEEMRDANGAQMRRREFMRRFSLRGPLRRN